MEKQLISIIMAAYNAEEYISDCIESVLSQSYSNWEFLICDDCSTDKTPLIIKNYQQRDTRIHLIENKCNLKAGASRNRCISLSEGKFIVIQDADDISTEDRLETLYTELMSSDVDFLSSGHYLFDENGKYKVNVPRVEFPEKKDFLFGIPFCHAATIFKKRCLQTVGGYRVSKETRRGQDYDLFMRLYAAGYHGRNIKNVLYGYRVDKNTIGRRKLEYRIDECKIRYKGFKSLGLLPRGLPYVVKPIAAHFVQLVKRR